MLSKLRSRFFFIKRWRLLLLWPARPRSLLLLITIPLLFTRTLPRTTPTEEDENCSQEEHDSDKEDKDKEEEMLQFPRRHPSLRTPHHHHHHRNQEQQTMNSSRNRTGSRSHKRSSSPKQNCRRIKAFTACEATAIAGRKRTWLPNPRAWFTGTWKAWKTCRWEYTTRALRAKF